MSSVPSLLTAAEVADITKVSVQTVYRWANAEPPVLPAVRIGEGVIRFRESDVLALLAVAATEPKGA